MPCAFPIVASALRAQRGVGGRLIVARVLSLVAWPTTSWSTGARSRSGSASTCLLPRILAAHRLLSDLVAAGVTSFKIEGRYKGPEYVAGVVGKYRAVLDGIIAGHAVELTKNDEQELAFIFSRGFSEGWLRGPNYQSLSHGLYPSHRGLRVGTVEAVRNFSVFVRPAADAPEVKAGDWMVFCQGDAEGEEQKGGVFSVGPSINGLLDLRFGDPGPDLSRVRPGAELWKSHDSAVKRRALALAQRKRRIAVDLEVCGSEGRPLEVCAHDELGRTARVEGEAPLAVASSTPLSRAMIEDKLGAFGDTGFALRKLELRLAGELATSPAALKRLRRALVTQLEAQGIARPHRTVNAISDVRGMNGIDGGNAGEGTSKASFDRGAVCCDANASASANANANANAVVVPTLIPLCRSVEQVRAVLKQQARCDEIILDLPTIATLNLAASLCHQANVRFLVATPRVAKPGDEAFWRRIPELEPHGIVARHLGAIARCREAQQGATGGAVGSSETQRTTLRTSLRGDFSLNVANAQSARVLLEMGLSSLTPAYDLDINDITELAQALPRGSFEVVLHQHVPLMHTEYCLFASHLSSGRDHRECGKPCMSHRLKMRDHKGFEHPVVVDPHCRNTIFNAHAQSAAPFVRKLINLGVTRFRVEFVLESGAEAERLLGLYRKLLNEEISAAALMRDLTAGERFGASTGMLAPLA